MPQGRDSLKTTLVRITYTRSIRETRLVGKTKLVRETIVNRGDPSINYGETDQRRVLVAYRVVHRSP